MITLKEWMEMVDYRITEGDSYGWNCYGDHAYQLSSWNGVHGRGGWSANIVFDTQDQTAYEVYICDYTHDRAYRIINPDFLDQYKDESDERGELGNQAWDDVDFIDLEVDDDFMQKCLAIVAGEDYDTRVSMPVDFSDEDLFRYMKLAHERDITLNQLIEQALRKFIAQNNVDKDW
jgi:hypothetical protein